MTKLAVGAIFVSSKTHQVMLNLRAEYKSHPLEWSLWGGMLNHGEHPRDGLLREIKEEMALMPNIDKIYPFDIYRSKDNNFEYHSYVIVVGEEFIPVLNRESAGYCWVKLGHWPKTMHSGARISFCNKSATERISLILSQHQVEII